MKKLLQRFTFSLVVFTALTFAAHSQILNNREAAEKVRNAALVKMNTKRQSLDFAKFNEENRVDEHDHLSWLKNQVLKANDDVSLHLKRTETDQQGINHYRYDQFYKGLPVEHGVYYVHAKAGKVESVNGEYYNNINLDITPAITKAEAFSKATANFASAKYKYEVQSMINDAKLVILPLNGGYKLAYKLNIYSVKPLMHANIYIDAATGAKLKEENRLETVDAHGTAVTAYNGTRTMTTDSLSANSFRLHASKGFGGLQTYNLNNGSDNSSATEFTNTTNYWNATTIDKYAYDAHFGAEATYDFYKSRFNRNSIDNAGMAIISYVHYEFDFVNAFWDPDANDMTYGDGDGVDYTPLTCLDIVGHEITHGVTEFTAGLAYAEESGALNEAFSDCMGVTIDYFRNPTTANFLEGDQCNVDGIPFRNMGNPNEFQNPDCYGGLYWNDPDEVHNNSGVMNFWYYLICNGGSATNDLGNPYTVNSIGMTDASSIIYRSLTQYLTPNSDYADARFYSIQAATDLFGACSNQVIQITNAWYAVGVGSVFSNAVVAGFQASKTFFCTVPATVTFTNQSINATSYRWSFGDGQTATTVSPAHTYSVAGTYTVSLISNGSTSCSTADTMIRNSYISVSNGGGPIAASCTPASGSPCCGIGITHVQLGSINKSTSASGYQDYTCSDAATLTAGDPVAISVTTGTGYSENVKCWIDYNNDGQFNNTNEWVFFDKNVLSNHSGTIRTSASAVLNTALRMRIMDDIYSDTITSACSNPQNGQAQDYTITFHANTVAPTVNFSANATTINVGGTVKYTDLSQHVPTSWRWKFEGGTPAADTTANPSVVYNTIGTYSVSLRVANAFGADSTVKTAYIHVVNSINMCTGVTSTTAANGQLYDSGGPSGSYQDDESCSLLINPGCAVSITISFSQFSTESCCDHLTIYNGTNASAPLLLSASGSTIPSTVTAASGKMYITWSSDGSVSYPGFAAAWTSVIGSSNPPVAAFSLPANPPIYTAVAFTDQTTNVPVSWTWTFGDGQSSALQNPVHTYSVSGTYSVTLIANNCVSTDTVVHTITIQNAPSMRIKPDSISVTLACHDSIVVPVTIKNTSGGDLLFSIDGSGNSDTIQVLAFMTGADTIVEYPTMLNAINTYFHKYKITKFYSTVASDLQTALQGKTVLLFPSQEMGVNTFYTSLATVVQNFASAGGNVIVVGGYSTYASRMYNMGLFTGSYYSNNSGSTLNVLDTTNDITKQVPLTFSSPYSTMYHTITNSDKKELVAYTTSLYDVVTYRNIGSGRAIFIGFNYYNTVTAASQLIANAVSLSNNILPSWIKRAQLTDTLHAGDSTIINVTVRSANLYAGSYRANIIIHSNDPLHLLDTLPVHMTIAGPPAIALSDTCFHFGLITQYTTKNDTLTVSNNGCDTLRISSVNSTDAAFAVAPSAAKVAPGKSQQIIVSFHPLTIGAFNAVLTVHTNAGDTTICAGGSSGAAPVISINPDSVSVTLSCNDSSIVPVTIKNTGGSDLLFNTTGSGSGNDTVQVLAFITPGVDTTYEYPNMINSINTYFHKYKITKINTTVASDLQKALAGKNVLLFPPQFSGSTTIYSSLASVIQNFAASGGNVIVLDGDNGTSTRLYSMGLFTGSYMGSASGNTLTVTDTTDNLMEQVPLTFSAPYYTYYHSITNADKKSLVKYSTYDVVTYRNIGAGKAIFIGFSFDYTATASMRIIANAISLSSATSPSWLGMPQIADTLHAGDSVLVSLKVKSTGFNDGSYRTAMIVHSNDPRTPVDTLPIHMTVAGPAEIALSDSCFHFGLITQFTTAYDTLSISNNGCDTLRITSINSTDASFAATPSVTKIAPGVLQKIIVSFHPLTVNSFSGILTIHNNAHDTTVCVNGSAGAAPVISLDPASLSASLNACGDSVRLPVYVVNNGGSNLTFNINGSGGTAPTRILAMTYGVDLSYMYPNTIASIHQYYTNYTIDTSSTIVAATLQSALVNHDVLLFPEQETNTYSHYTSFASVVQNFVSAGGTVILCGAVNGPQNRPFDMGLFTGNFISTMSGSTLTTLDTTDDIADQVPLSFSASNLTVYNNFTNTDKIKLVEYGTYDVVTYRRIGSGKVIFIGFDYYGYNAPAQRLISNAVKYANSSQLPSWLKVNLTGATVTPGDSQLVYVTLHSDGLAGGNYSGRIIFNSNDPLHGKDTLPVTLQVAYNPCANFNFQTPSTCSGIVAFRDTSKNSPTSWQWTFGDGSTPSSQPSPTHTYSVAGTYSVKLKNCNATSCDSITKSVTIQSVSGPLNASCSPATTGNCCGMGITHVTFNTINKTSGDGSEGYKDFTCTDRTTVTAGQQYAITITTGTEYNENVRVWIDYNNDGIFNASTELVFSTNNIFHTHSGTVFISNSATVNTPLRMRIGSDYYSNAAPAPCTNVEYGQFEDYTVFIQPNTFPPVAAFSSNIINSCTGDVRFTDNTVNNDTAWRWDFGDHSTLATVQNPEHFYQASGTYTIKLVAVNHYGADSTSHALTVNVLPALISFTGELMSGQELQFNPNSISDDSYHWDFGNEYQSTKEFPYYTYKEPGVYIVALTVVKGSCTRILYDTLDIMPLGINELSDASAIAIFPNPFHDEVNISYTLNKHSKVRLEVVDMLGRTIETLAEGSFQQPGKYVYKYHAGTAGIYFVRFIIDDQMKTFLISSE